MFFFPLELLELYLYFFRPNIYTFMIKSQLTYMAGSIHLLCVLRLIVVFHTHWMAAGHMVHQLVLELALLMAMYMYRAVWPRPDVWVKLRPCSSLAVLSLDCYTSPFPGFLKVDVAGFKI